MLILDRILGQASDSALADRLHDLSHAGHVEPLSLSASDIQRHRLRLTSDRGTDCAIRLERHQQLRNGSVLMLDGQRAIVVQMQDLHYLDLQPRNVAVALELGYFAGNMHWTVRFSGTTLQIPLNGPEADYLEHHATTVLMNLTNAPYEARILLGAWTWLTILPVVIAAG